MRLLRQLTRRKLRTTLTILGITIRIWALVVETCDRIIHMRDGLVEGVEQRSA